MHAQQSLGLSEPVVAFLPLREAGSVILPRLKNSSPLAEDAKLSTKDLALST